MAEHAEHGPMDDVDDADRLRAQVYTLLAQLLARPPSRALLNTVAGLSGDGTSFGRAIGDLATRAASIDEQQAGREYFDLLVGVTRGELVPFASYYRTGFLNDRPLARLREDMQALGIERAADVVEPEDHIASIAEMMAALIDGSLGPPDLHRQKRFFDRHLAPWAGRFFADLETAEAANLYRPVGTIGRLFLDIEADAFAMLAHAAGALDEREGTSHAP
ncbi:TorD/DmsD family molecular chaperone [Azospirillum canadense]|uniref:TorD/DmsD family molecular chaperone n=1 Tax=Azospirillum canadense TaxID=403962 RepID=UPI00222783F1|nr:molecular chaperone TorD family protein [Azospirillum canadense]MCW2244245.1 TorA maturation chaperone TorD [Azospirillum canadense]